MNTAKIFTPKGEVIIIDAEDFAYLNSMPWFLGHGSRGGLYVVMNKWRGRSFKPRTDRKLFHRVIMGSPEGKVVDHINGNTLDNRKVNLRICDQRDNVRNQRKTTRPRISKYKGVSRSRSLINPWRAYIGLPEGTVHLGVFKTEEEAAQAYDKAASETFGAFASLNFKYDRS